MDLEKHADLVGKPTLLVTLNGRCPASEILKGVEALGYPSDDVAVYYRPEGTDQVIDAVTGEVAAGQAINDAELKRDKLDHVQTVVLMHPDQVQFRNLQQVFTEIDPMADMKYAGPTYAEGVPGGVARQDLPAAEQ